MDRQIENAKVEAGKKTGTKQPSSYRSGHLMCRTPLWGVAGFLGCAYLAWGSFSRVTRGNYDWPHDFRTAAPYILWLPLLTCPAAVTCFLPEPVVCCLAAST